MNKKMSVGELMAFEILSTAYYKTTVSPAFSYSDGMIIITPQYFNIVPSFGREHVNDPTCWCLPCVGENMVIHNAYH